MSLHVINPLADRRWDELVARHPQASAFHTRGWLEALRRSYGYEPFALTSAAPGEALQDGVVLCRVRSWLTGTRLVSLPFADHCEPLVEGQQLAEYLQWLREDCERTQAKYVEIRPLAPSSSAAGAMQASRSFWVHTLDTRRPEHEIFKGLHSGSVQRKIRRAEREHLSYETGGSEQMQDEFYRLLLLTRRRHSLPPQPRNWFRNLMECMGDRAVVRVARKDGVSIAAMLTLHHGRTAVYKYGCSDEQFHNLGGVALLFWRLIQESKASGVERIDFGRTDLDQRGLITFKDHWGAEKTLATYYRYPAQPAKKVGANPESPAVRKIFAVLPDAALTAAGRLLYRHMG